MRSQPTLPGDYKPTMHPDPAADGAAATLARVYALILSWPLPEELQQSEEDTDD